MDTLYLKRNEIAKILNMSERKARAILEKYGVKPVDLGHGRGNGLRWRTSAVIRVADTLHAEAQTKNKSQKRIFIRPLQGRTAAELFAEFNQNGILIQ